MTFHIPHVLYYKYPYTHEMLRASRENFERETLEKTKIDLSIILNIWFSKFLYSHPLHWHILAMFICQILISPYPLFMGKILMLPNRIWDSQEETWWWALEIKPKGFRCCVSSPKQEIKVAPWREENNKAQKTRYC